MDFSPIPGLRTGMRVYVLGSNRDYVGAVRDINEKGMVLEKQVIIVSCQLVDLLQKGFTEDVKYVTPSAGEEDWVFIPFNFEIFPFRHKLPTDK